MGFPATLIPVKNRISSSDPWVHLFEIYWPRGGGTHYLTANNADITWNGHTYLKSACGVGQLDESGKGELPKFSVWIHLPDRALSPYLDASGGGKEVEIRVMVVNAGYLSETTPALDLRYRAVDTTEDSIGTVRFDLGVRNPCIQIVCRRMLQKSCTYREPFKGPLCAYSGAATECDRTFTRCRELGNTFHTGCFQAMGKGGVSG